VWTLNYGRVGTPEEIAKAKKVLGDLNWAPFNPSTDHQLLPIRRLEVNKDLLKIQADDKLPAADKAVRIGKLKAEIAKIEADEKAAQNDPQQKRIAAFIAADKAGNQDALKKMIAEFRAAFAGTN
jgi:phosphonate transport system substrate-binding protein